jgi:APA family basic amino acid/polyamine antiporter
LPGFLYGWTAFTVIMSGGIAALAAGFAEYLGVLVPSLGGALERWVAAAVIVGLTAINHRGVAPGAALQRLLTIVEVATIASFIVFGLVIVPAPLLAAPESMVQQAETAAASPFFAGAAAAMVAVLWCYDGWYGLAFSAGEMRHPERDVPRGMVAGTGVLAVLYILVNATYARALPGRALTDAPRVAESAAVALFGHAAARAVSAAILITTLGCLATTILYSSRIYLPMARDGIFVRAASIVHPRFRTPTFGLWGQSTWAVLLALTGTYRQLYTSIPR